MNRTADRLLASVLTKDGPAWTYSEEARAYRETSTGRFMTATTRLELRDEVVKRQGDRMRATTERLNAGEITPAAYEKSMQAQIKSAQIQNYSFGRGGIASLTDTDKQTIAADIETQHKYLAGFRADIEAGTLSDDAILARANLYGSAGTGAYEKGKASAYGMPALSQYPGDGQTICKVSCACSLDIVETDSGWNVTWELGGAQHCEDCSGQARKWSPLSVARGE